ncbi:50S ribosomal protein L28 [Candidatus Aerophobetes bacterium]|nr:50S ribosomal protein L28 [Candidatus Aerophobetes bacterium]
MMKRCQICGKQSSTGHTVSHSKRRTKRRWLPNLQRVRIKLNGKVMRAYVCTSCIRSHKVEKAV